MQGAAARAGAAGPGVKFTESKRQGQAGCRGSRWAGPGEAKLMKGVKLRGVVRVGMA